MPRRARSLLYATALSLALLCAACKQSYNVGDHVLVEWEGADYPAMILESQGPTKYKVHYDGYEVVWDEVVAKERVKGFVEGDAIHPPPPAKVRAKSIAAAKTNLHKIGDRVRVEWHGQLYSAIITEIVGHERYRIHYEGYGNEWDETVELSRIQPR